VRQTPEPVHLCRIS